jgi:hypothetical protein
MKMPALLMALRQGLIPLLLAAALHATLSQAQPVAPPELMSYQGYLTDGTGNPLGPTSTGPKNYNVVFRIWDSATLGTELYAEQQTVTVDTATLASLGEGGAYQSEPHKRPLDRDSYRSCLPTNGKGLFVEFAVVITPNQPPVTIAPRLQLLASPYAFLAANAANVSGKGVITANNIASGAIAAFNIANNAITTAKIAASAVTGTSIAGNTITGNNIQGGTITANNITGGTINGTNIAGATINGTNIISGTITGGNIAPSTITGGTIANGTIAGGNIMLNTISTANLGPSVQNGLWGGDGNNIYRSTGKDAVGIVTTAPLAPLHVTNIGGILIGGNPGSGGYTALGISLSKVSGGYAQIQSTKSSGSTWGNLILEPSGGSVGIGTSSPYYPLEVDTSATYAGTVAVSIYTPFYTLAAGNLNISDERIKNIKGQSDSAVDLKTLLGLHITDYTYMTPPRRELNTQKVIAQQVEKVYPQAVKQLTGVVPDIYQKATLKDGWVQLATDLKVGERVKLIDEKEAGVHEVLEVRDGAFRTDFKPATNEVFVYGREVKDFRSVDYDAISMLNISATQELARRLEKLEA